MMLKHPLSALKRGTMFASLALLASIPMHAQCFPYSFASSAAPDQVVGTGSPFTFNYYNESITLYAKQGGSPNYIYQDTTANLSGGSSTGLVSGSQGLGDETATQLGTVAYMSYLSSANVLSIAKAPTGTDWSYQNAFSVAGVDKHYVPTILAYNGTLVAAYVVNGSVYVGTSSNGQVFTPASASPVSTTKTRSRPALAILGNTLYIAYTSAGSGNLMIGPLYVGGTYAPNLIQHSSVWGNSNTSGVYAGVTLLGDTITNQIYAFGQITGSSQYLQQVWGSGTSYSAANTCSNYAQLRWTPSVSQFPGSGYTFMVFQGDHNPNVWYGAN